MRGKLAIALSLALLACNSPPETKPPPTPAPPETPAAAPEPAAASEQGKAPPGWSLPRLDKDGTLSLADLKGNVVLVTFFASWCGPCRMEMPALEQAWAKLRDKDVVIVGISMDDEEAAARDFLRLFPVTYPLVFDRSGGNVGDPWGVSSIPASFVLDREGLVRKRHVGFAPKMLDETVREIESLLQE